MNKVKLLNCFLISFITQGVFTSVQAVPPSPSMAVPAVRPIEAPSAVSEKGIPTLEECIDPSAPWGLNLNSVDARQVRLRKAGKGGTSDAAKDIINLQQLLDKLQESPVMEKDNQEKILQIKDQIKEKMVKSIDKKTKKAEKKQLEQEIAQLNSDLQKENATLVMFKNALYIKTQMDILKESILKALGEYGLTSEQLEKLPSLKTWRANSAYKQVD